MRLPLKFILFTVVASMLLAACNLPDRTPNAPATIQAVYTAQASTAQAQFGGTVTATPGIMPTVTVAPSQTPKPTSSPASPTQKPYTTYCDWAAYVKDVTVPDGTTFAPDAQFTKTWRLQNIGTCSWTSSYTLVFSNGNNMTGPSATAAIGGNVNPGQYVDISVNLRAPMVEGSYRGYWQLRNAAGVLFGLGPTAREPFYVDIKVVANMGTVYDFAGSYCNAAWMSGSGTVKCTDSIGSNKGSVSKSDNPQLENGQIYSGPGLLTIPENIQNGFIKGTYPLFTVQKGDRFRSIINCAYLANGCNGIFRLDYQLNDNTIMTIWQFAEAYEGKYYTVDIDLSPLDGYQVKFILTVQTNGSPNNDRLLWAGPRIVRPANLITPSPTPSITPTVAAYP